MNHWLRALWRLVPGAREARGLDGTQALIACTHSGYRTPCQLRRRPGDLRKSCWEVCHNCGTWLACNC